MTSCIKCCPNIIDYYSFLDMGCSRHLHLWRSSGEMRLLISRLWLIHPVPSAPWIGQTQRLDGKIIQCNGAPLSLPASQRVTNCLSLLRTEGLPGTQGFLCLKRDTSGQTGLDDLTSSCQVSRRKNALLRPWYIRAIHINDVSECTTSLPIYGQNTREN